VSLPTQAIDRLFQRLAATYGASWDRSLGQAPTADAKSAWAHELQGFAGRLDCLAWALENLPEKCPNVIEFRNLCRRAPEPQMPRLPEPAADPERVKRELAKLGHLREPVASRPDTDWARRIVARAEAGAKVAPLPLRMAREVVDRVKRRSGEDAA
jgi:hypothetical protein